MSVVMAQSMGGYAQSQQAYFYGAGLLNPYSIAPTSMPYAYGSTATTTYTQQWPQMANTFEQHAVPQPDQGDRRIHLDRKEIGRGLPQTSHRRDSDSQWSQITSNHDS